MNKKFLFTIAAVLTAILVSFSSIAVFAAGEAGMPEGVVKRENSAGDVNTDTETTAPENTTPVSLQKKAGDVDGNGEVNINDVTVYQLTLAGKIGVTDAFNLNAETVTDNKFNITDATGIQYYVAGTFRKLPVTPDGYYAEIIRP